MSSIKRTVGAHTKARSIGELERARNTDDTIHPSFLRSPGMAEETQRGRGEGPNYLNT